MLKLNILKTRIAFNFFLIILQIKIGYLCFFNLFPFLVLGFVNFSPEAIFENFTTKNIQGFIINLILILLSVTTLKQCLRLPWEFEITIFL